MLMDIQSNRFVYSVPERKNDGVITVCFFFYQSLVWQCRYGGVEVPDHLWTYQLIGKGKKYSEVQAEDMVRENVFMKEFDNWVHKFAAFVGQKGKVSPGKYRAFGYQPQRHMWANVEDGIRYFRMMAGIPPKGSSPQIQQELNLNKDATWHTKKGEGEKLRDND